MDIERFVKWFFAGMAIYFVICFVGGFTILGLAVWIILHFVFKFW